MCRCRTPNRRAVEISCAPPPPLYTPRRRMAEPLYPCESGQWQRRSFGGRSRRLAAPWPPCLALDKSATIGGWLCPDGRRRNKTMIAAGEGTMIFARAFAVAVVACLLAAGVASAQTYPSRPITLIVAFPPGGADDATARMIQAPFQKALGQPVVIENVGGAGGMIAAARAARATPDGYTILQHQDALAAGMALYPTRTFDAEKDFVTIGLINTVSNTLAGRPTLPPNNFKELLAWMKEPGRSAKIGHPGVGSFGHLAEVLAFQEMGVKVTQVPYRGAGPALV